MTTQIDWSLDSNRLKRQLLKLSKSKLIKLCKSNNVTASVYANGNKNDLVDNLLNKKQKTKKQTNQKIKPKVSKQSLKSQKPQKDKILINKQSQSSIYNNQHSSNIETIGNKRPKTKPITSISSTMTNTTALNNRLAQLQSIQQRKKKSLDRSKSLNRIESNVNRDRYYSITTIQDAKKIQHRRQQEREQIIQMKNKRMKGYIQSKKNTFDSVMVLKDKKLAKVDNDNETAQVSNQQLQNNKQYVLNPSVEMYNGKTNKNTNDDNKTNDDNIILEPMRLKQQLPNGKGEKFELYTWLKPTKLLGETAYAAICEVIDSRTN
eukprot:456604_1